MPRDARSSRSPVLALALGAVLLQLGCEGRILPSIVDATSAFAEDASGGRDAGPRDVTPVDVGPGDSGLVDLGLLDLGIEDQGVVEDAEPGDVGDAEPEDGGPEDLGPDAGPDVGLDVGLDGGEDAGPDAGDAGAPDTGVVGRYLIGGVVEGLTGMGLVLRNGAEDLPIAGAGAFRFASLQPDGASFDVVVAAAPRSPIQHCRVEGGRGAVNGANVTTVRVRCADLAVYPINGSGWGDWIEADGSGVLSASDRSCDPDTSGVGCRACLHGGELRRLEIPGVTSCTGVTIRDRLGAFRWSCGVAGGVAWASSVGLVADRPLADLFDFASGAWRENAIEVSVAGTVRYASAPQVWWETPVVVRDTGIQAGTASPRTVHLVSRVVAADYVLDAERSSLVSAPTAELRAVGVSGAVVSVTNADHVWVEASIDATDKALGLELRGARCGIVRNTAVRAARTHNVLVTAGSEHARLTGIRSSAATADGVVLRGTTGFPLRDVEMEGVEAWSNGGSGVVVDSNLGGRIGAVRAVDNAVAGVSLSGGEQLDLAELVVFGNRGAGLALDGVSNAAVTGLAAGANGVGVSVDRSPGAWLHALTVLSSAGGGVEVTRSERVSLSAAVAINNGGAGFSWRDVGGEAVAHDLASSDNGGAALAVTAPAGLRLRGRLLVGPEGCQIGAGVTGIAAGCRLLPPSDATRTGSVSVAASIVGAVRVDDPVNGSDQTGARGYDDIVDRTRFSSPYRGWGRDDATFPSVGSRGPCSTGVGCRIWDLDLRATDTRLRAAIPAPVGGDDVVRHLWSITPLPRGPADCAAARPGAVFVATATACEDAALRGARERRGDLRGDDDGRCEGGEACVRAPNLGVYPGHGAPGAPLALPPGRLGSVDLAPLPDNGR